MQFPTASKEVVTGGFQSEQSKTSQIRIKNDPLQNPHQISGDFCVSISLLPSHLCFFFPSFAIQPAIYRSAFWGIPESAPASAFGVLFGSSQKVPRRVPRECPENWECHRECSRECFFLGKNEGMHSREHSLKHSQFSRHSRGHSPGHFLGTPKKHSESTRRSTFGDSPESTPVNGRLDRNPSFAFFPLFLLHPQAWKLPTEWGYRQSFI